MAGATPSVPIIPENQISKIQQEEIVEVAVNVRKIEIPQNQAKEVVEKLRKMNCIIDRIENMKAL